jgi:ribonuclease PH
MRIDKRASDSLRKMKIKRGFIKYPEGSVLISAGNTMVLCNATIEDKVPPFLKGKETGWVSAEYSLLPRSTGSRNKREAAIGRQSGRTQEIQRLIGRALRSVVDLKLLGERTILLDCDVLQADGGTRTASITGAFIALTDAVGRLPLTVGTPFPVRNFLAAVSVGIVAEEALLDLCYAEDSAASVDMNIAMTDSGHFVEVQGTGEEYHFTRGQLNELLDLGEVGCRSLIELQKAALGELAAKVGGLV